jgi:CheY-like chemotaxis protein
MSLPTFDHRDWEKMTEPRAKPVILLIDDEPILLLELEAFLLEAGFDVLRAHTASAAIKLLDTHDDILLAVADIALEDLRVGYGLISAIRTRWPPVKLIIVSGRNFDVSDLPPDIPVLRKPFIFSHLEAI